MMRHVAIIVLALTASATMAKAPREAGEKTADNGDKVVCKRFVKTGSLVDSYRTCKPKREWERDRENLRALSVSNSCRNVGNGGPC
jgi:hypothetical protein